MSAASRPCAAPAVGAAKTVAAMIPSDLKRLLDIDTPCRGICGLQQVRAIIPSWFSPGAQPQRGSARLESVGLPFALVARLACELARAARVVAPGRGAVRVHAPRR